MSQDSLFQPDAPWKQRFRAPSILWTRLAKNAPVRGLAASNRSGIVQLYSWRLETGDLQQLTDRPEGVHFAFISPDGKYVYYHRDTHGNEIGHLVRIPFEGGQPEDITPDLPPYPSPMLSSSRLGNLLSLIIATPEGRQIHILELGPEGQLGSERQVFVSPGVILGNTLSMRGELLALGLTIHSDTLQTRLLVLDTSGGQIVTELEDGPEASVRPVLFSPLQDDLRLIASSNQSGVARPFVWNPRTGERLDLALDGLAGEIQTLDWSADGQQLLLCHVAEAVQCLYIYDLERRQLRTLKHPGGYFFAFVGIGTYFASNSEIFAQWEDATHPSRLIALDTVGGSYTRTLLSAAEVPPGSPWHSIHFLSRDGQRIQGWLATPTGQGPFPTILETHGGPAVVAFENFHPRAQTWLDAGFAYLSINYRGSTTFGRDFERIIWGHPGHWEVEDMVAARTWLVEQGIARANHVFLTGRSYGGYLTLLALGLEPDLWAGGMAHVAIADWTIQYEDSSEAHKSFQIALFEGTPQENPEQYAISSPITYLERVNAPMLIIQGRNDSRCAARSVERYVQYAQALGKQVEVIWFEVGHEGSILQIEQGIEHQEQMLRFALHVLENQS
jgi:acetyl esterase/lipase